MRETEIKSIINEATYNKVLKAFKWDAVTEQTNHYYRDENGALSKHHITFRIRVIGDAAKIQVKHHKNKDSALQICEENEFPTENVPETLDCETAEKAIGFDVGTLHRMGSAHTRRHTLRHNGCELCLDKTEYFDTIDYEVEMEYEDKMSADLLMKLTSLGVTFNKSCVGKFSRFLAEYEKHKG